MNKTAALLAVFMFFALSLFGCSDKKVSESEESKKIKSTVSGRVALNKVYGFIDKNGKQAIDVKFSEAKSFSEGLAAVELDSSWGFSDKSGNIIIEPEYDDARNFSEGLAPVRKGGCPGGTV